MKYEDVSDYTGTYAEKFYSFYYLNTHFVFINGNTPLQNSVQTAWLQQKLNQSQANPDVDMVFCFTHQPGRSELWPDGNTSYIQNDVIPILQQFDKVQLLAYGHSHNYERGTAESKVAPSNGDFYLMLTGGAGSALDRWGMYPNQTNYDEIMMSLDHYIFNIVDIDIDNQSFEIFTFSLGHSDKPLNCVLVDYVYRKLNQPEPEQPFALSPSGLTGTLPLLTTSPFAGVDSVFSVRFQVTQTPGNYSTTLIDKRHDIIDIYSDSGTPLYNPVNLNQNIDMQRFHITTPLTVGQQYAWRVAYRDNNMKWSQWSAEQLFTVGSTITPYTDFSANITQGPAPLEITFTDLTYPSVNSWNWDFNNDGLIDSQLRDPSFEYTAPGFYTVTLTTPNGTETKNLYINVEDQTVTIIENNSNDLLRVHPNPCYESTGIEFYLSAPSNIQLQITDSRGRLVSQLFEGKLHNGKHNFIWDLKSSDNASVSPGTYFVILQTGKSKEIKKIVVLEK